MWVWYVQHRAGRELCLLQVSAGGRNREFRGGGASAFRDGKRFLLGTHQGRPQAQATSLCLGTTATFVLVAIFLSSLGELVSDTWGGGAAAEALVCGRGLRALMKGPHLLPSRSGSASESSPASNEWLVLLELPLSPLLPQNCLGAPDCSH